MKDREYTEEEIAHGMAVIKPYAELAGTSDIVLNNLAKMYTQAIEEYRKRNVNAVEQNIRFGRRITLISIPVLLLSVAGLGYSIFNIKNQQDSNKETTSYIAAASTVGFTGSLIFTAFGRLIEVDNKITRRRFLRLPESI